MYGNERQRHTQATFTLYNNPQVKNWPSTFLQRDLRRVLDRHQLEIDPDPRGTVRRRDFGDLFERAVLEDAPACRLKMETALMASKPSLKISAIRLRPRPPQDAKNNARKARTPVRQEDDSGPSWLPAPDDSELRCHVTVAVIDLQLEMSTVFMDSKEAIVRKVATSATGSSVFEVRLREAFDITFDTLVEKGTAGMWTHDGQARFQVEMAFRCHTSNDTAKFLNNLEDDVRDENIPADEWIVRTRWSDLPRLPERGQLRALTRTKDRKVIALSYRAEIAMHWNENVSALTTINRAISRRQEPRQLPTPASDVMEPRSTCFVKYIAPQGLQNHRFEVNGLRCVLCPRKTNYPSFERLLLHLRTYHDHFDFEANESEAGALIRSINISAAGETRQSKDEETDWQWQAPRVPFNATGYLNGDTTWTPQPTSTMGTTKRKAAKEATGQQQQQQWRVKRRIGIPSPEEVEDLPEPKRKKHKVPHVKGVHFYRKTSKQVIEPGEELSDSDNEIEQLWFVEKQRRAGTLLGQDDIAQDFNELFNRHLDRERPTSDRFSRDAIVRFARTFASKLCEEGWREKVLTKLEQMDSRKVFGEEITLYCLGLLDKAMEERERAATPPGPRQEIPESPNLSEAMNGDVGNRMRWAHRGRNGQAIHPHEDDEPTNPSRTTPEAERLPFGLRNFIIRREPGRQQSVPKPISKFPNTAAKEKPEEQMQPSDISFSQIVTAMADKPPFYFKGPNTPRPDSIVYRMQHGDPSLIDDENTLHSALDWLHKNTKTRDPMEIVVMTRWDLEKEVEARERARIMAVWETPTPPVVAEAEEKKVKKHVCVCEKPVHGMRGAILCQQCVRSFHMACLGMDERQKGWKCDACIS